MESENRNLKQQLADLRHAFDKTIKYHADEEAETRKLMTELLRKDAELSLCQKERDQALSRLAKEEAECLRLLSQLEDFSRKHAMDSSVGQGKAGINELLSIALQQFASDEEHVALVEEELATAHEQIFVEKSELSRSRLLLQLTEVDLRRTQMQKGVLQSEIVRLKAELTGSSASEKRISCLLYCLCFFV